jgi:Sulfotransferase family
MSLVEVVEVSLAWREDERILDFWLDFPKVGPQEEGYSLNVAGWVVGRKARAVAVEVTCEEWPVRRTDVWLPILVPDGRDQPPTGAAARLRGLAGRLRQDAHRLKLWSGNREKPKEWENSGFQASVGMLGLPHEFELRVDALLDDSSRVLLATVKGRHEAVRVPRTAQLSPILVSYLARSGSTWLMRLLSQHPEIVVFDRFPYETFVAIHALRMLRILTMPANPARDEDLNRMWGVFDSIPPLPFHCPGSPVAYQWLRRDYVERFAAFCTTTIDGFYGNVAEAQGKTGARFFAEKAVPLPALPFIAADVYPDFRQIILVRDPRDVLCSQAAFFHRDKNEQLVAEIREAMHRLLLARNADVTGVHVLRYEDLVAQPVEALQGVFAFLGLADDAESIRDLVRQAGGDSPELAAHRTAPSPESSIGRFRRDLDPSLRQRCEEVCGALMADLGYTVEG